MEQKLGELIYALRLYAESADRVSEKLGSDHGFHRTHLRALALLIQRRDIETTVTDIGRLLNLSSASATALVDRLVEAEHVERVRAAHDRRRVLLQPTAQALCAGREVFKPLADHLSRTLTGFTEEQYDAATRVLLQATQALENWA